MIGRTFASLTVLALAIAGCGSTVNDPNEADQGAGGSTGNGTTSGNGPSGTGGTGTSGPGTTGTGAACVGWDDEQAVGGEVVLRVVNHAPVDIYLPRNCSSGQYSLLGEDGVDWHQELGCQMTCQQLQTQPHAVCGDCLPSVIQVPSFGTADIVWSATGLEYLDMPDYCWFQGLSEGQCARVQAAPAQTYRVEVAGYAQCEGFDGEACACTDGVCQGAMATGQMGYHEPTQFSYPSASVVEVVFETCAFGCPNDDPDAPQPGTGDRP